MAVTGQEVQEWAEQLERFPALLARLERERGWSRRALVDLEIGFDGERITVPIWRSATPADRVAGRHAVLQGLLRLRLDRTEHPKVTAIPGTRLGVLPLPAWTREERVLLVEGPSDMLAARSAGLPAIAVPGANAWRSEWASALDGRRVVVVMDCDRAGRQAAARIAEDLERRGIVAGIGSLTAHAARWAVATKPRWSWARRRPGPPASFSGSGPRRESWRAHGPAGTRAA